MKYKNLPFQTVCMYLLFLTVLNSLRNPNQNHRNLKHGASTVHILKHVCLKTASTDV